MAKVIWTQPAISDLEKAFDYLAEKSGSEEIAERICTEILDSPSQRLERWPESGAIVEPLRQIGAREIHCHSYRVIYVHRRDACYVIICIHSSRDLARHLDASRWESLP